MTIQIGRLKLFIISVILLFLIFFAPNLRMLMIGKQAEGTVFKLSAFTAGEHNSRVNFIAEDNKEYRFEVNSNVVGQSKVIYDPKKPENAYLFNFMNFVLEKIIYSLLAAIPATIFVFFFLKKNQYLFIDLKRFKISKGLKRWTEADEVKFNNLLKEPLTYNIKSFEYAYILHPDAKYASKLINVTLQSLFIHKQIGITNKLVQVNKTDDKLKPRPFVGYGANYSNDSDLSEIEKELLSIFENTDDLRLHEIRLKLQQKFGVEYDKFHHQITQPFFAKSPLFSNNKPTELGKSIHSQVANRITFIENHLDYLLSEHIIELSLLLDSIKDCWLFIPTETFDKIRNVLLQNKENIQPELLSRINSGYARVSIN